MRSLKFALPSFFLTVSLSTAQAQTPFFERLNGAMYHYVRESETKYADIRANIESGYYGERGIRYIVIYCPYASSGDWRGVPAIDFFSTNSANGTIDDFTAMTTAAHERGMAVVAYMGLLFVDPANAEWVQAQEDKANDVSSEAVNIFRWANAPDDDTPFLGGWDYSEDAESYYATSWTYPAIDIGTSSGQAYVQRILEFWIDRGVDGFEYDAPQSFWGQSDSLLTRLLVTEPNAHRGSPLYLIAEGGTATFAYEEDNDALGFTHILLNGDDDARSFATDVMDGEISVDELEEHFERYIDRRRDRGLGVKSVSTYRELSATERALEAAVLAGNGSLLEIDYEEVYSLLDPSAQQAYGTVLRALARSSAEAPFAARTRLPTGSSPSQYAVLRTSISQEQRALNVYNFAREPAIVRVDLSNSGLEIGDVPRNLVTEEAALEITERNLNGYPIELPSLGYAFLGFGEEPPPGSGGASNPSTGGSGGQNNGAGNGGRAGGGVSNGGAPHPNDGGSPSNSGGTSLLGGAGASDDGTSPPGQNSGGCGCSYVTPRTPPLWAALGAALLWSIRRRPAATFQRR